MKPDPPTRAPEGSLRLRVFSRSQTLWEDLREAWRADQSARLVVSGPVSRRAALSYLAGEEVVWGERVCDVVEVWNEIARELSQDPQGPPIPRAISGPEVISQLSQLTRDTQTLRDLPAHPSGLGELAAHTERIAAWIDYDYSPQSAIEEDVAQIIRELHAQGVATHSSRRSLIARSGWRASLGGRLLFAPLPDLNPQLGGLLRALRYGSDVEAWLVADPDHLQLTLERISLADHPDVEIQTHFESRVSPQWRVSDDEIFDAARAIREWMEEGEDPSQIAVISPHPEDVGAALCARASELGVPMRVRDRVSALSTRVGAALTAAAGSRLREGVERDILRRRYGWEEEQLLDLSQLEDPAALLGRLSQLGWEMIEREPLPLSQDAQRASFWLSELDAQLREVSELGAPITDARSFLIQLAPPRQIRGEEGVALLGPNEAATQPLRAALVLGWDAEGWPSAASESAFVSELSRSSHPQLENPDWRPIWSGVVGSAPKIRVLRRRGEMSSPAQPSAAWTLALGSEPDPQREWKPQPVRHKLTTLTERARWARRLIRAASADGVERAQSTERRPYTVTELERYEACPLGWMVDRVLRPRSTSSERAARGSVAHIALAKAMREAPADRASRARSEIERAGREFGVRRRQRESLIRGVEGVIERFGAGGWPYPHTETELDVSAELQIGGESLALEGRLDRLDWRELSGVSELEQTLSRRERVAFGIESAPRPSDAEDLDLGWDEDGLPIRPKAASAPERSAREILVIDYKLGGLPDPTKQLQPYVYPVLAAHQLSSEEQLAALRAFLFVSLRLSRAEALTVGSHSVPIEAHKRAEWIRGWDSAQLRLASAVEGIESGEWARIGERCSEWCSHHIISQTGGAPL